MALTVRSVANALLRFFAKEQRVIPVVAAGIDDPLPDVIDVMNGALQEMVALGPTFVYRARRAVKIYAPTVVSLPAVTAGALSFTLTTSQGWQDWMLGCSMRVGTERWNEIVSRSGDTVKVLQPMEASGAATMMVYHDAVVLPDNVLRVMAPVAWADAHLLSPVDSLGDLHSRSYQGFGEEDYGTGTSSNAFGSRNVTAAAPTVYFVDSVFEPNDVTPCEGRIRLAPMPRETGVLQYRARLTPAPLTRDDIYAATGSPNDDPGTEIPVPADYVESVFLPICKQRLTASPYFRNAEVKPEIERQFLAAREILKRLSKQSKRGMRMIPGP